MHVHTHTHRPCSSNDKQFVLNSAGLEREREREGEGGGGTRSVEKLKMEERKKGEVGICTTVLTITMSSLYVKRIKKRGESTYNWW